MLPAVEHGTFCRQSKCWSTEIGPHLVHHRFTAAAFKGMHLVHECVLLCKRMHMKKCDVTLKKAANIFFFAGSPLSKN